MNSKILKLVTDSIRQALMPRDKDFAYSLDYSIDDLPLTYKRKHNMLIDIQDELGFPIITDIPIKAAINEASDRYLGWFFSTKWVPRTGLHSFTGWAIVDEVKSHNPKNVLDFGCGYNQFKDKLPKLIGIDPFNEDADYMVTIDEFVWTEKFDAILALGSLNFNSLFEIESQFAKLVSYLSDGGRMYFRANPGISWPDGPYVDIFPWSFELAAELARKHNLTLETFKKDEGDRLYFVYTN